MNLSTLSGPELRQLLDAARNRGQAQLTYQILQEMEARRTAAGRRGGLFRTRRPATQPMALVLEEPPPPDDPEDDIPPMPLWTAPPRKAPPEAPAPPPAAVQPPRTPSARSRRGKAEPAPLPPLDAAPFVEPLPPPGPPEPPTPDVAEIEPPAPEPLSLRPPPPPRPARRSAAVFAVGLAAGLVLGVGASELWRDARPTAPVAAPVETAALTPPPAPATLPPAEPEPEPTGEPPAATDADIPAIASADPPPEASGPALELPRGPEPSPDEADLAEAPPDACAAQPTPADRTICADPDLQQLQRQLRRAYARALDAHEDRDLLRQRQLAWRDDRSAISDPVHLARLYEARIRRLTAATEAARRAR